jgi:hypothetical protein
MTMKKLFFGLLISLAAPFAAFAEPSDRDQQWIFREKHGDGSATPAAIFLSWNYASVIMKAECQADEYGNSGKSGNGGITLYYYPTPPVIKYDENGAYIKQPFDPFVFSRGKASVKFKADVASYAVIGNIAVTPELLAILKPGKDELEIEATIEMEEPWHAGQAEPLYRLAQLCAKK